MILLALAAAASSQPALAQAALQPWSAFVGQCWSGPAPGGKAVDVHCFDSVYGGQHVRDRHEVRVGDKVVYAGETLYSVEGEAVTFIYWNSLGGVGHGKASADGPKLSFSGEMRATPTGASQGFTATWRKLDGAYEVSDAGRSKSLFRRVD
jgi:hypothetical protein